MTAFEQFWEAYPKERRTYPKAIIQKKYDKATKDTTPIELLESLENYKRIEWKSGWRFIPQMSKWFNQQYWKREFSSDAVNYEQKSVESF